MPPSTKTTKIQQEQNQAAAVIAAAASLALGTLSSAANEAQRTLSAAAAVAQSTLTTAADRAALDLKILSTRLEGQMNVLDEKLSSVHTLVQAIDTKVGIQNGRVTKGEKSITRLNLVIFGIVGPLALTVFGFGVYDLLSLWIKAHYL